MRWGQPGGRGGEQQGWDPRLALGQNPLPCAYLGQPFVCETSLSPKAQVLYDTASHLSNFAGHVHTAVEEIATMWCVPHDASSSTDTGCAMNSGFLHQDHRP